MVAKTIEDLRLNGHLAVGTGASRGLGEGCALALAGAGADLVLIGRNSVDLTAVAAKLEIWVGLPKFWPWT